LGESIDEERNQESCKAREEEGCYEEKEVAAASRTGIAAEEGSHRGPE
jgi:hypothetical protein